MCLPFFLLIIHYVGGAGGIRHYILFSLYSLGAPSYRRYNFTLYSVMYSYTNRAAHDVLNLFDEIIILRLAVFAALDAHTFKVVNGASELATLLAQPRYALEYVSTMRELRIKSLTND